MFHHSTINDKKRLKEHWEEFNRNSSDMGINYYENNIHNIEISYSHMFFKKYNLNSFLDESNKYILQFGAYNGLFLKDYQQTGWKVIGYDYCDNAIKELKKNNVNYRQIDLNSITDNKLTYQNELETDLMIDTHVLAIRMFEYLDPQALIILMFTLIDKARPGTTYFIANTIHRDNSPKCMPALTENYIASFFGARTDIEFLFSAKSNKAKRIDYKHSDDEMLVVRKRRST